MTRSSAAWPSARCASTGSARGCFRPVSKPVPRERCISVIGSAILKMAEDRLDEVKKVHRRASLVNPEAVRVIFLLKDDPEKYHQFAAEKECERDHQEDGAAKALSPLHPSHKCLNRWRRKWGTLRERVQQLKEKRPGYGEILDFYVKVREAQAKSKTSLKMVP